MNQLRIVACLLGLAAGSLAASNFSFTGSFSGDDGLQLFDVTVTSTSLVTFETLSYGGGINSAGTMISAGGFDPRLTWFQGDGTEIGSNNGGVCGPPNSFLGACNDAYVQVTLDPGSYVLALTQDGNDPNGNLSDGFGETGNPNFTANGSCTQFCDSLSGDQLSPNWAVDILSVNSAVSSPEPVSTALTGSGLVFLGLIVRRRKEKIRRKRT